MENAIQSSPASSWGDVFKGILGNVVDTGAQLALKKADEKQAETLAQQQTVTAQANAAAVQANAAAVNSTNAATIKKYALYAGAGVAALVALVVIIKAVKGRK